MGCTAETRLGVHALRVGQDRQDSTVHQDIRPCLLVAACHAIGVYCAPFGGSMDQTVSFLPVCASSLFCACLCLAQVCPAQVTMPANLW